MDVLLICEKYPRKKIAIPDQLVAKMYDYVNEYGSEFIESDFYIEIQDYILSLARVDDKNIIQINNMNFPGSFFAPESAIDFDRITLSAECSWALNWDGVLFYSYSCFEGIAYNFNIVNDPIGYLSYNKNSVFEFGADIHQDDSFDDDYFYNLNDISQESDREKMLKIQRVFSYALKGSFGLINNEFIYFSPGGILEILDRAEFYLAGSDELRNVLMSNANVVPLFSQATASFLSDIRYLCLSILTASEEGYFLLKDFYMTDSREGYVQAIINNSDIKPLLPPIKSEISDQITQVWVKFWDIQKGNGSTQTGF
jgi:hypothetical protein